MSTESVTETAASHFAGKPTRAGRWGRRALVIALLVAWLAGFLTWVLPIGEREVAYLTVLVWTGTLLVLAVGALVLRPALIGLSLLSTALLFQAQTGVLMEATVPDVAEVDMCLTSAQGLIARFEQEETTWLEPRDRFLTSPESPANQLFELRLVSEKARVDGSNEVWFEVVGRRSGCGVAVRGDGTMYVIWGEMRG